MRMKRREVGKAPATVKKHRGHKKTTTNLDCAFHLLLHLDADRVQLRGADLGQLARARAVARARVGALAAGAGRRRLLRVAGPFRRPRRARVARGRLAALELAPRELGRRRARRAGGQQAGAHGARGRRALGLVTRRRRRFGGGRRRVDCCRRRRRRRRVLLRLLQLTQAVFGLGAFVGLDRQALVQAVEFTHRRIISGIAANSFPIALVRIRRRRARARERQRNRRIGEAFAGAPRRDRRAGGRLGVEAASCVWKHVARWRTT